MKSARLGPWALACIAALVVSTGLAQSTREEATRARSSSAGAAEEPRDVGLIERAQRRLVQLDVSVSGPWERISDLGPADFVLAVEGKAIEELTVDRACPAPAEDGSRGRRDATTDARESADGSGDLAHARTSYLLYFDQRLLTAAGRQNSIDIARRLVPELIRDGSRGAIVSSGKKHETLADLTDDPERLIRALDRLEGDHDHWLTYPTEEELRIRDVLDAREHVGVYSACGAARRFQMEEAWQTDKALRVFSLTLGHLAGLEPPKVVFYFADMMRKNAGEHFLAYAGRCSPSSDTMTDSNSSFGAEFAIDRVIEEAASHGTRIYTVRGEGLVAASSTQRRQAMVSGDASSLSTTTNHQRYAHAGDSLNGLAVETGGRSFIHGETSAKMVQTIERDMGCIYLLSFDPEGLSRDQSLRVSLSSNRPKVKIHSRGRLVIQSDEARKTSELMAAFAAPGSVSTDVALAGSIVPTGFASGRYSALVQLRAPGSSLNQSEWHFGASLLTRGELKNNVSGSVRVDRSGVPVVFETEMEFWPGPFELILVGHESVADQIGTRRIEGDWPVQDDGPAVGPIALMQPASAAFVRAGSTRRGGAMALAESENLRPKVATALIGLVCRGPGKGRLRVERALSGEGTHQFPPMEIDFQQERCAQIRDLIPESTMTSGRFVYQVRLLQGDRVVAEGERTFDAVAGDPALGIENQEPLDGS